LSFDRIARVIFKKKSKRRRFSKKTKQKSTACNRVFDQVSRVTPGFFFPFFSSIQPDFILGSTSRAGPDFKAMI
jgi:hypothetical protein